MYFFLFTTREVSQSPFHVANQHICLTSKKIFNVNNNIYHLIYVISIYFVFISIARYCSRFDTCRSPIWIRRQGSSLRFQGQVQSWRKGYQKGRRIGETGSEIGGGHPSRGFSFAPLREKNTPRGGASVKHPKAVHGLTGQAKCAEGTQNADRVTVFLVHTTTEEPTLPGPRAWALCILCDSAVLQSYPRNGYGGGNAGFPAVIGWTG